jgi:hypothetical protein
MGTHESGLRSIAMERMLLRHRAPATVDDDPSGDPEKGGAPHARALAGMVLEDETYWLVGLDPETGACRQVSELAGLALPLWAGQAFDDRTNRYYFMGEATDGTWRAFILGADTGQLVGSVEIPDGILALAMAQDGGLLGLREEEYVTIDATTGATTHLSSFERFTSSWGLYQQHGVTEDVVTALDLGRSRIYHLSTLIVATFDATSAEMLGRATAFSAYYSLGLLSGGRLASLGSVDSTFGVVELDPETGTTSMIAPVDASGFYLGDFATDASVDRAYVFVSNEGQRSLLTLDASAGATIFSTTVACPQLLGIFVLGDTLF